MNTFRREIIPFSKAWKSSTTNKTRKLSFNWPLKFEIPGITGFFPSLCSRLGSIFAIDVPLIPLTASLRSSLTYLLIPMELRKDKYLVYL